MHSQDEERDEVVVVFCVNTGRLLGTFEGARESLLGGGGSLVSWLFSNILVPGGVVSQTQSGIMEVRKVVDDGLLLLGSIEDLRRRFPELDISPFYFCFVSFPHPLLDYRALYCPAPSSPLLAIYGMIDGGEVSNSKILLLCIKILCTSF